MAFKAAYRDSGSRRPSHATQRSDQGSSAAAFVAMMLSGMALVMAGPALSAPQTYDGSKLPKGLRQLKGEELRRKIVGSKLIGVARDPERFSSDGTYILNVMLDRFTTYYTIDTDKVCVELSQGVGCYKFYVDSEKRYYCTRPFDAGEQLISVVIQKEGQ